MRDELVWHGWRIEGGDLVPEALTRRPPVGPEMPAETPRAGDGKAGEAAVAGDLAAERVPGPRAGPVGIAPPVEDDRPDPSFRVWGLRSWASSDRTGAGRGSTPPKQRQALSAGDLATLRARRGRSARRGVVVNVARSPQERNPRAHMGGCELERRYGHGLTLDHSGLVQTSRRTTGTKTRSGARCLPLAGDVVALLSTLRAEHGAALDSNTSDQDSSRSMRTARRYVPSAGRTCGGRTARRQAARGHLAQRSP